jgi:hypothetical protein
MARFARSLAPASAGNSNAARMAMMAITTSNSIKVKALYNGRVGKGPAFFFMRIVVNVSCSGMFHSRQNCRWTRLPGLAREDGELNPYFPDKLHKLMLLTYNKAA